MLYSWESNHRSAVALAVHHRLCCIPIYRLIGLRQFGLRRLTVENHHLWLANTAWLNSYWYWHDWYAWEKFPRPISCKSDIITITHHCTTATVGYGWCFCCMYLPADHWEHLFVCTVSAHVFNYLIQIEHITLSFIYTVQTQVVASWIVCKFKR